LFEPVRNGFGDNYSRAMAGFVTGTYAIAGKEVVRYLISAYHARTIFSIEQSRRMKALLLVVLSVVMLIGLFSWFISWEGDTKWRFGAGVFVAVLLADYGLVRLAETYHEKPLATA